MPQPHGRIPADSPHWDNHSGGSGHTDRPEWGPHDTREAAALYGKTPATARAILDTLIDNPGRAMDHTEIADQVAAQTGITLTGPHSVSTQLKHLGAADGDDRAYPFKWWKGEPSTFAMRPHVAALFSYARTITP